MCLSLGLGVMSSSQVKTVPDVPEQTSVLQMLRCSLGISAVGNDGMKQTVATLSPRSRLQGGGGSLTRRLN